MISKSEKNAVANYIPFSNCRNFFGTSNTFCVISIIMMVF